MLHRLLSVQTATLLLVPWVICSTARAQSIDLCVRDRPGTAVGHVWMTFDNGAGSRVDVGFWPKGKKDALTPSPGKFKNDNGVSDYFWRYNLPPGIYNEIVECVIRDMDVADGTAPPPPARPKYKLICGRGAASQREYNCASWAIEKLLSAGLNVPDFYGPVSEVDTFAPSVGKSEAQEQLNGDDQVTPGTMVQSGPNSLVSGPQFGYGATPTTGVVGLSSMAFEMNGELAAYLDYPVFDRTDTAISVVEGDLLGIAVQDPTDDELGMSAVKWGDGTEFDFATYAPPIEFQIRQSHIYSHTYSSTGTPNLVISCFMGNGVERVTIPVNVSPAPTGYTPTLVRHYVQPSSLPNPVVTEYTDNTTVPAARPAFN